MEEKNKCYFCDELFTGKVEVEKMYDSEYVFAFKNLHPEAEKDIVIVPKKHIKDLTALIGEDEIYLWEIVKVAKYIAKTMIESFGNARLITDMGNLQNEPHLSFRLIAGKDLK
jgi:histidine triad (HIT) family protein